MNQPDISKFTFSIAGVNGFKAAHVINTSPYSRMRSTIAEIYQCLTLILSRDYTADSESDANKEKIKKSIELVKDIQHYFKRYALQDIVKVTETNNPITTAQYIAGYALSNNDEFYEANTVLFMDKYDDIKKNFAAIFKENYAEKDTTQSTTDALCFLVDFKVFGGQLFHFYIPQHFVTTLDPSTPIATYIGYACEIELAKLKSANLKYVLDRDDETRVKAMSLLGKIDNLIAITRKTTVTLLGPVLGVDPTAKTDKRTIEIQELTVQQLADSSYNRLAAKVKELVG